MTHQGYHFGHDIATVNKNSSPVLSGTEQDSFISVHGDGRFTFLF